VKPGEVPKYCSSSVLSIVQREVAAQTDTPHNNQGQHSLNSKHTLVVVSKAPDLGRVTPFLGSCPESCPSGPWSGQTLQGRGFESAW